MKIEPRIGLEDVFFGMTRDQVLEVKGEPEHVSESEHAEGEAAESWYYPALGLALHFEEECEWRLKYMETTSPDAKLKGEKIIGFSPAALRKHLRKKRVEWGEEEGEGGLFYSEAWDMNFWFRDGAVESVQWEVRLDEDDNYMWPK
ncbi:MAG: hypothetical protein ACI97A_003943 [Planctomycetota bacterium]|jgi:hypothetical protein